MMNTADKNEIHTVNWNELTEDAFSSILYQFLYSKYFHLLLRVYSSLSYAVTITTMSKKCRQSQRVSLGCLMVLPYTGAHYCHLLFKIVSDFLPLFLVCIYEWIRFVFGIVSITLFVLAVVTCECVMSIHNIRYYLWLQSFCFDGKK